MARPRQIAQLGNPVLRQRAEPVEQIDDSLQSLIDDLFATSAETDGAGIAAPQIDVCKRVFILSINPSPRYPDAPEVPPAAVINPEILWQSERIEKEWEGCLSVRGFRGLVPRPTEVKVRYLNRGGEVVEQHLTGFHARVFLHEYDHLEGITWLDRVEDNREIVSEQEFFRRMAEHGG